MQEVHFFPYNLQMAIPTTDPDKHIRVHFDGYSLTKLLSDEASPEKVISFDSLIVAFSGGENR